jgi:hypothetical protein
MGVCKLKAGRLRNLKRDNLSKNIDNVREIVEYNKEERVRLKMLTFIMLIFLYRKYQFFC